MKRNIAWILVFVLCLSLFAGCGKTAQNDGQQNQNVTQNPAPEVKDDGKMKVLMIGASLGFDTMYMMPEVARLQGEEDYVFGILYHSAALNYHEGWLRTDAVEYAYLEFDSTKDKVWYRSDCNGNMIMNTPGEANDKYIEDGSIAVKASMAFERHDWDVVITMGSSSEVTGRISSNNRENLNMSDVETVMEYANSHDLDPSTPIKFGWHMVWALPQDDSLLNDARREYLAEFYEGNAMKMFEANVANTEAVVVPYLEGKFSYILPCATAIQNAKSSAFVTDKDIHRDYIHGTDYGRLIAAYTWYCGITDTDIKDCKFGPVYHGILLDTKLRNTQTDWVLTEEQQNILVEAVGNAFANPYQLTESQYQ